MSEAAPPSRSTRRRRIAVAIALGVVALLIGLQIAYVIVGNWYLRERLPVQLNKNPERILVEWSEARTTWPGRVRVTGLRIRKQNRRVQWDARVDEARARIGLLSLLARRFSVNGLDGEGMTLRLRFVPGKTPGQEQGSPHAPPIEGFADPPLDLADGEEIAKLPRKPVRWSYSFDGCEVKGVRELWIGPFRYAGDAVLRTSLSFTPRQVIDVGNFELDIASGDVHIGPDILASGVSAEIDCDVDSFEMDERPAVEVLDELSAQVRLDAKLHDVQLPRASFPKIPWLGFGGRTGQLKLDLRIDDGSFANGTDLRIDADAFTVAYPGYLVDGSALLTGAVTGGKARANATFGPFEILKDGATSAHVRGSGFGAELRTEDLSLRKPLETFEVELTLPDSEVIDFNAYDDAIPAPLRVHVDSGTGTIRGNALVTQDGGHGRVDLTGRDIALRYAGERVRADLELAALIPSMDFDAGQFDFSGTELAVKNASVLGGGSWELDGWWGKFKLDTCKLQRGAQTIADVVLSAQLRDTRPLVAIVASDRPAIKLFRPLLVAPDATVHARLQAGPQMVDLDELTIVGTKLDLRACMDLRGDRSRGVVFVDGGMLSAGLKFQDGRRNVKPLAGKDWFAKHSPLCEDPSHLPPD